ncbi:hypothetical protein BJY14_006402 [Actinomadura luteofluorescens]|uniref:Uncharacterized protein n=1 Tax=Actinomadura luteofluorescens TaxID=46163 RepID=A0A7Y9EMQ9_9ACTN|nr:hypothetical protein [Actinomadura luteofluorescens]NYD50419.1 hypothetical protein [Actinomadura luteofluorescens]
MSTDGVRLTPEWALWGKDPQERDFRLLRCSDVRLGRHDFSEIISRYSPGTHTDLPQVAISWTRLGDEIYLGFAIQEWSSEGDRLGRDIAVTRYFGVPYFQLRRPISYVDLYEALATYDAASGEPISVPGLDPHRIAARAGSDALGAAALLLTRSPVQIEGAEGVPMLDRLRFLDTVAALLPYPMRTRFSAVTWVSSTSEHNFRLAFSSHVREGALPVMWSGPPAVPPAEQVARTYLDILARQGDLSHVIGELAQIDKPMGFGHLHIRAALRRLQDIADSPPQRPAPVVGADTDPAEVLRTYADARRNGRREAAEYCVDQLEHLRTQSITAEQRGRYRQIVKEQRLLEESPVLAPPRQLQLYQALLQMAYASTLSEAHLDQIEEDAGMVHGLLLRALENYPCADPVVDLLIAVRCGEDGRRRILGRLDSGALVAAAAREPLRVGLFDLVFRELARRLAEEEDAVGPLWRHAYLAHPLRGRFPNDDLTQFTWLRGLLEAAYGPQLGVKEFEEVVDGSRALQPTPALFAAALSLHGPSPDAGAALFDAYFGRMLRSSTLGPQVTEDIEAILHGTVPDPPPPSGPPQESGSVVERFVRKIRPRRGGRGRHASPSPSGTSAPPSWGEGSRPDERPGRSRPRQNREPDYDAQGPWITFLTVVVLLLVLTLLVLTLQWLRLNSPPP